MRSHPVNSPQYDMIWCMTWHGVGVCYEIMEWHGILHISPEPQTSSAFKSFIITLTALFFSTSLAVFGMGAGGGGGGFFPLSSTLNLIIRR